jgi:hypothetical protein
MNNDLTIYNLISNTSDVVLIISTFLFLKDHKKNSIAFKLFSYYLLFILIIQIITGYMRYKNINNLYVSHYYFIGQFIFISLFFLHLEKQKKLKKLIKITSLLVLVSLGFYYLNNPKAYYKFNIYEIIVTSIPLVIYSFYFFIKKIENEDNKFIYLNSGLFVYLSCSTLIFTAGNVENTSFKNIIWYSNVTLYLLYQILILVEWYKNFRLKKEFYLRKQ